MYNHTIKNRTRKNRTRKNRTRKKAARTRRNYTNRNKRNRSIKKTRNRKYRGGALNQRLLAGGAGGGAAAGAAAADDVAGFDELAAAGVPLESVEAQRARAGIEAEREIQRGLHKVAQRGRAGQDEETDDEKLISRIADIQGQKVMEHMMNTMITYLHPDVLLILQHFYIYAGHQQGRHMGGGERKFRRVTKILMGLVVAAALIGQVRSVQTHAQEVAQDVAKSEQTTKILQAGTDAATRAKNSGESGSDIGIAIAGGMAKEVADNPLVDVDWEFFGGAGWRTVAQTWIGSLFTSAQPYFLNLGTGSAEQDKKDIEEGLRNCEILKYTELAGRPPVAEALKKTILAQLGAETSYGA